MHITSVTNIKHQHAMGILGTFLAVLIGLALVGVVLVQLDVANLSLGTDFRARNITSAAASSASRDNNNTQVSFVLNPNTTRTSRHQSSLVNRERRIIYLHHIHKAGGSILCAAARLNGLKVNYKHNCNVQPNQECCGNEDSLQAQQEFALSTKFQFVTNEADLLQSIPDSQHYRYVIQLRDSQQRYQSHWKHVVRIYNFSISFSEWWRLQPDNWTVRKICGSKCRHVAKFNLSRDEFQYTLKRLHLFDDILLLERFNESFARFTQQVGWNSYIPKAMASTNKDSRHGNGSYPCTTLGKNSSWDLSMTALDNALYEYTYQLYNGTNVPILSREMWNATEYYFQQGPRRGCTTPCCSQECSKYRL